MILISFLSYSDFDVRLDNMQNNSDNNANDCITTNHIWEKVSDVFSENTIQLDSISKLSGQRSVKEFQGLEPVDYF